MPATISLSASADYGHTGQYIARLTGRNSKFTFEREFIGTKGGKRGDYSSAEVDDPGVYMVRNATRKGNVERFLLVVEFEGELHKLVSDKEDAMVICKALDTGRPFADIVRASRENDAVVYEMLTTAQAKQAGVADITAQCVALLRDLDSAAQKAVLKQVKAQLSPPAPVGATALPEAESTEVSRDGVKT